MFKSAQFWFYSAAISLLGGCTEVESKKYVCSDQGDCITVFEYRDEDYTSYTILSYGKYEGDSLPESYAKVRNKWRDGWDCLLEWKSDTAVIYEPYGMFKEKDTRGSQLRIIKIKDTLFYKMYYNEESNLTKLGMDSY